MSFPAVDLPSHDAKNGGMTGDERARLGRKLRAMRVERGLKQLDVAAKIPHLSVGTLQAIETNKYSVRDTNIEKLAHFFGTTALKLLKADEPKMVAPTNPLLRGLNEEHLQIAQGYKDARKRVRAAIEMVLAHADDDVLPSVILRLEPLRPETLTRLEALMATGPDDQIFDIAARIQAHPQETRTIIYDYLDQLDQRPVGIEKQKKVHATKKT